MVQWSFYSFLNKEYKFKFKYFLFEIKKVSTNNNKNKLEINNRIEKEKCQLILKKCSINIYENKFENINEKRIMGIKSIIDSNTINLKISNLSRPKILKTRFW